MSAANPLLALAAHAASWRDRPLPPALAHHARRALVDWFAALFPGARQAPASLMAPALAAERGEGGALCYADGRAGAPRHAALLNATAAHTVEFDDIHRDSGLHPGAATIAAALAVAQDRGLTMAPLLRGIIAGYEAGCRIALAVQPSHYQYWHVTGTVGTLGAAAAGALLLGADKAQMANALATAATMASGLQQAFRGEGMSKPLHPGHAADAGLLAARIAMAGVTGAPDVLHGPVGFAAATSDSRGDWKRALDGLDRDFTIAAITFKNHGCCGHIFPALDGLAALRAAHGFAPEEVERIEVSGYRVTKELCDRPQAATEQEARFSLQYCLAALLHLGGVRLAAFTPEALADPALRATMRRISLDIAPELAEAYPRRRAAHLRVALRDGRVLSHTQPNRKGDPEDPLSDAELSDKFHELVTPVLGAAETAARLQALWHGEALPA